jgi:glycosyltransferase involved in cell wall biosynthesis
MEQFDSIICIGQTPWEGDFQKAIVQLMTCLSVRHRVLYVDYQYTLKDWLVGATGSESRSIRSAIQGTGSLTVKKFENGNEVYVWYPPIMLPVNWLPEKPHDWLIPWNTNRLVKGLRRIMQQLNMQSPLVVNAFNPVSGLTMLNKLNERATLYYCFDEISVERWTSRHGKRYEVQYLQRVDAVITTSETLRQIKSALQPNAFCVKNGVNFKLFNRAVALEKTQPKPTRPIVGYLGTADNRIDLDLVEYCIQTMPDVLFRFIGEVNEPDITQRLSPYANVDFIPPHQPHELPLFLAQLKVAIIPYVCNAHTYTIYPLKINEYLAAGLPVVSTPFSLLDEFDGIVELARDPASFALALKRALTDESPLRRAQRIATAQSNSWEKRAMEFEAIMGQFVHLPQPTVRL